MMRSVEGTQRTKLPGRRLAVLALLLLAGTVDARAQTATVRGFVTGADDGRALQGATVALYHAAARVTASPAYGAITNVDGVYLLARVRPGRYRIEVSFIGFETYRDTLDLEIEDVVSVSPALEPRTEELDELVVEDDDGGMANVEAGRQTIRPADIQRVPSLDIAGDLASFLTTLPGVVSTGDQGGQFFVRGGEPTQNLVLIDGMHVYEPFYLLGYYSVFPTDILNRAEFYAGGYPSSYGTRLSSVLDVGTRNGNNRRFEGMVGLSPFTASARIEGPIVPGRISMILTGRESTVDRGADRYIAQDLPFEFGDAYGKVHAHVASGHEITVTAMRTHERGLVGEPTGGEPAEDIHRTNEAVGVRAIILPKLYPLVANVYLSHSRLKSRLGPLDDPIRSSGVRSTRFALDAYFPGDRADVYAGWEAIFTYLDSELGGLYQNVVTEDRLTVPGAFYGDWNFHVRPDLNLQAGARVQFFNVQIDPYIEPRIRAVWTRGEHRFSAAAGVYQQELVGVSDQRDAASVFTVWTRVPKDLGHVSTIRVFDPDVFGSSRVVFVDNALKRRIGRAYHGIVGYGVAPTRWLELSAEVFYKEISNLFVAEWTALPELSSRLHPATGRSGGIETRFEVRRDPFYAYLNYGLSSTLYTLRAPVVEVWYDAESFDFRPPHDRRHQVDALISTQIGGFDLTARWAFGSGLPYTRPRSYDGFIPVDDVSDVFEEPRSRRVIFEEPFSSRMPTYHRLDFSVKYGFDVPGGRLMLQGSVMNAYDRRNIFYYDTFTFERVDQLPVIPSIGLQLVIE